MNLSLSRTLRSRNHCFVRGSICFLHVICCHQKVRSGECFLTTTNVGSFPQYHFSKQRFKILPAPENSSPLHFFPTKSTTSSQSQSLHFIWLDSFPSFNFLHSLLILHLSLTAAHVLQLSEAVLLTWSAQPELQHGNLLWCCILVQ